MQKFPINLVKRLEIRKRDNSQRTLFGDHDLHDFSSNDYLGFASNYSIFEEAHNILKGHNLARNGATGSRLLTGNHRLYHLAEKMISKFFLSESALIYNSGYDANLGFFSSVPQRGDVVFYDEYSHASIRDGLNQGKARTYKFSHNDLVNLEEKIDRVCSNTFDGEIYVVTEAVFSMDGDLAPLKNLVDLVKKYEGLLVVDEAHSAGIMDASGKGLSVQLGVQDEIFARLVTFGKAFGAHGAAVLGGDKLKQYLVNFSRSLIYTTALPPHSVATILASFQYLQKDNGNEILILQEKITFFKSQILKLNLGEHFIPGNSAIHSCVMPGNDTVKAAAKELQKKGFDVKPILSPTVPEGMERLRVCLHSFNSYDDMEELLIGISHLLERYKIQK